MRLLLLLLSALIWSGCHRVAPKHAGIDTAKVCAEGGATLSGKECVCANGSSWNGSRCVDPAASAAEAETSPPAMTPPVTPPVEKQERVSAPEAAAEPIPEPKVETSASTPQNDLEREAAAKAARAAAMQAANASKTREKASEDAPRKSLAATCARAEGLWGGGDKVCHCPFGKVLVGDTCQMLAGALTADICLGALYPGEWRDGKCGCAGDRTFSPFRGGCVVRAALSEISLRRICESSLNKGKWETRARRCFCPSGKVWAGDTCAVQEDLASRNVCESPFNRGSWHAARKRCACPAGRTWIDQSCRPTSQLSPEAACSAEGNGGRWVDGSCNCPGGARWDAALKACS